MKYNLIYNFFDRFQNEFLHPLLLHTIHVLMYKTIHVSLAVLIFVLSYFHSLLITQYLIYQFSNF